MSSEESDAYETAEEGNESDGGVTDECVALYEYGFFLYVSEDGTRWYLPMDATTHMINRTPLHDLSCTLSKRCIASDTYYLCHKDIA